MRIPDLRKKIIVNFSVALILLIALGAVVKFYLYQEGNIEAKVEKINTEINQIKGETTALESKAAEIKKYTGIWQTLSPSKTATAGIKIDEFNAKLNSTADKYSISGVNLKISLPEALKEGVFKRDTVDIMLTTVNLTFVALNDTKALSFINEFLGSIQGYPVVTAFEIRKAKNYNDQDFENIAAGKGAGAITAKVDFSWYVYKDTMPAAPAPAPIQAKN